MHSGIDLPILPRIVMGTATIQCQKQHKIYRLNPDLLYLFHVDGNSTLMQINHSIFYISNSDESRTVER